VVAEGDTFEFLCASGGGWGDPLCRDPDAVAADASLGRISAGEAADIYGVVLVAGAPSPAATEDRRAEIRRDRLARARPALRSLSAATSPDGPRMPLYPGVEQIGRVAVSVRSGAVLAEAPDHWTDGCPVLSERRQSGDLVLHVEAYLDPETGHTLCVDVRPEGIERTFTTLPDRWVFAGTRARSTDRVTTN